MTEIDVNEVLKDHVTLDVECIDRIYLNGYIPNLQMPGQWVNFLRHRGYAIPSPAILGNMTDAYKAAVVAFAAENAIPLLPTLREQVADLLGKLSPNWSITRACCLRPRKSCPFCPRFTI